MTNRAVEDMNRTAGKDLRVVYQHRAIAKVYAAIQGGALPRPETLVCVDCGERASGYDHREYTRPLDVVPVCGSCNVRRGPATLDIRQVVADLERDTPAIIDGHCTDHPAARLVTFCPACRSSKATTRKTEAARANGKKGGRPPKTAPQGRKNVTKSKPASRRGRRSVASR